MFIEEQRTEKLKESTEPSEAELDELLKDTLQQIEEQQRKEKTDH